MTQTTIISKHWEQELQVAVSLAQQASKAILPYYFGGVSKQRKADGTPVTEADRIANEIIGGGLQKTFPHDGIVSEELQDVISATGRTWYVDPIDGTEGFIGHSDQFAIHIGLATEKGTLLGLVYKPTTGEHYFGSIELGAWRVHPDGSKRELHVAEEREGLRIVVNTTFLREQPNLTDQLNPKKVYVSGSLGLRAMRVAEGLADVYVKETRYSGGTWDTCAPQAIVEAAGGYVAYTNSIPVTYTGQRRLEGRLVMARSEAVGKYVSELMERYTKG